ncbi:nitrate reductase cytochrome c-type subunit [Salipaludibacillus aurantiacus]|uniref:Nitrate reductase cytochrome c-type subunit n=1 Tax=Salipaludibacillus aurantiacus TaxID=1601833 RepID=A0A1H9P1T4_9BACI|nr:nitrate reductase cytochrome c-type subunit [Salipaludibacillus aurantiacus]SER42150.1 Nitrate reductase cytochrome c-type subunit [Salipaludibacillus aurantiacus]
MFKLLLSKTLLLLLSAAFIFTVAACSGNDEAEEAEAESFTLPQLTEERADAATMVLVSAPPVQPEDHVNRWNAEQQEASCLTCHENEDTGAAMLPDDHYIDNNRENDVYRTYCIQCHGEQKDDKPGFNRDAGD